MSYRHLARSIIMQTLFEWDMSDRDDARISEKLHVNIAEFAPGLEDTDFIEEVLKGVLKKRQILDDIIAKAAPEWPLEKINVVDRNILRLGLYELLFGDREHVPPKVAINEAIELAKAYSGENSGRFVNGVLGAVYKEIGEPGKDQTSKKKITEPIDLSKVPVEQKGAAVVYSVDEAGTIRLAMVHDVFGYWTLSKGGIAPDESSEQGTQRKIKEEIGIDVKVEAKLGENEYLAYPPPENTPIRKQVTYFLARGSYQDLVLDRKSGGLDDARWFLLDQVIELTMYNDVTEMITKAIEIITKK